MSSVEREGLLEDSRNEARQGAYLSAWEACFWGGMLVVFTPDR